jgi:flagella basal body P-ring formation protein FlgA
MTSSTHFQLNITARWLAVVLLCWLPVMQANANQTTHQPHNDIRGAARNFIASELKGEQQVMINIKALDARLKLTHCSQPLAAFWPPGARKIGNVSVGVRCQGDKPWKIYVQATIAVMEEILVLNQPVTRGTVLDREMLETKRMDISRLGDQYVTDPAPLIGYRFRNSASQGSLLKPRMLEAPNLIQRGQNVTLISELAGLQIRVSGEALANATAGQWVKVRNSTSKRIVEGQVTAEGAVRVLP